MALKETYIANWNNVKGIKIRVARPSILGPSKELLKDYKENRIDWKEYEKRFREEILNNPKAIEKLKEIKELSKKNDVYLVCYEKNPPCHRFILLDILKSKTI